MISFGVRENIYFAIAILAGQLGPGSLLIGNPDDSDDCKWF
jgi:hypothetical protein